MSLGQKNEKKRIRKSYSEEWKRDKIRLLEEGKIRVADLVNTYGMSPVSVWNWRKKYGSDYSAEKLVIETESDYLKCISLEKELKSQQIIIGKMHIQLEYFKGVISEINKHFKIDSEKKFG